MLPVAYAPTENSMSSKCAAVLVAALSEKSTSSTSARRVPVTGAGSARESTNVSGRVRAGRLRIRLRDRRSSWPRVALPGNALPAFRRDFAAMIFFSSSGDGGMTQSTSRIRFSCMGSPPSSTLPERTGRQPSSAPEMPWRQPCRGPSRQRHDSVSGRVPPMRADRGGAMDGVSAAPNRSRITGFVSSVEPSTTSQGKWYLTVDVQDAEAIEGGLFARPGTPARVFAFGATPPVAADQTISAEVTYLGGPTGGEFQLLRLIDDPANDADEPGTDTGDDRPDPRERP